MTKSVVVCPVLSKEFASRGQIDLVDMQSMPKENYKRIMVHQHHLAKFRVLPPMKSERPTGVAAQLVDIFLLLGSPAVLQSDNGTVYSPLHLGFSACFSYGSWQTPSSTKSGIC